MGQVDYLFLSVPSVNNGVPCSSFNPSCHNELSEWTLIPLKKHDSLVFRMVGL